MHADPESRWRALGPEANEGAPWIEIDCRSLPSIIMACGSPVLLQRRQGALIAFVSLGIYLLLPAREFYWDGVGFARTIETSNAYPDALLHPNHLLYNLMGYAVWKSAAAAGIDLRVLFVLQALSALFAAASVYLVWHIVAELTGSARRGTWCALLFAFSAQWWRFAADADAYIPSIFFLLVSFRFLLPTRPPRPWAAGLAHGAAMLFHQLALFFFPVAVVGFLVPAGQEVSGGRKRQKMVRAAQYGATAFSITAAAYISAFSLVHPHAGPRQFWEWITVRSQDVTFLAVGMLRSTRYTVRGTMRLFFGGRVNQMPLDPVTVAGALAFGALAVLLAIHVVRALQPIAKDPPGPSSEGLRAWLGANRPALVWIVTYVVFLFFWQPQNTFYRLFYLPPLIFLLATSQVWRAHGVRLPALLAAMVCAWNFTVSIYPHSRTEANEVLSFALQHNQDWQQDAEILYSNSHSDLWLISYFNPQAAWIDLPAPGVAEVESRRVEAAQKNRPLWLEGTAYDAVAAASGGRTWLDRHLDLAHSLLYTTPAHRIRYYKVK